MNVHSWYAEEFENIKSDPTIRHPEKHFLQNSNRAGAYQGCFSDSHWGGQRKKHKWDMLMKHAPKIAKHYSEVPNSLRPVLDIHNQKWNGSKFKKTDGLHTIPQPLAMALEHVIMDRLSIGEEMTYDYVEQTLMILVKLWNEKISEMEAEVRDTLTKDILQKQNELVGNCDEKVLVEAQEKDASSLQQVLSTLVPCNVSTQPKALGTLSQIFTYIYSFSVCLIVYIFTVLLEKIRCFFEITCRNCSLAVRVHNHKLFRSFFTVR